MTSPSGDRPHVSLVMPNKNNDPVLDLFFEKLDAHTTYRDFELIVVDDGSKDSTPEVARSYGDRLRYVPQQNTGVAGAFNHGLRLARGRYISWLSHDDLYHEAKLERQVRAVAGCTVPALCYTDVQRIDSSGAVIGELELPEYERGEALRHLVTGGEVSNAAYSLFFDRKCIEEVGMYDEARRYTQDADMLIRLVRRFPFVHVPEKLIQVREHGERGTRKIEWLLEAISFHREWLDRLGVEELFPELKGQASGLARARARMWLGDAFVRREAAPFWRIPVAEYKKAAGESLLSAPALAARLAKLGWLHLGLHTARYYHFFRAGLRPALARKFRAAIKGRQP